MKLGELIQALAEHGIKLSVEGGSLAVDAPSGEIPPDLRAQLVANKAELLALLSEQRDPGADTPQEVVSRPEERFEPFPMSEIQQAYSVGRQADIELNAAMHAYNEIDCHSLDVARFEEAWNQVIARHEMLRAVALPGFHQRILATVPFYRIPVEDLRGREPQELEARFDAIRERLAQQVLPLDQWPLFELRVCQLDDGRSRLFMSIDGTFVDGFSFQILYRELVHYYRNPGSHPSPARLDLSFRDYALTIQNSRGARYERALAYWRSRLPNLPPAPDLPLERDAGSLRRPRFRRWFERLDADLWQRLKQRARARRLSEPELLLAAYAEVIARWSRSPRFTINVPHFNRLPLHPQVNEIIGTFASFTLIEVDHRAERSFSERALAIRDQLLLALEHRDVSGVDLLRELFKTQGRISGALMPVVMTSFASHGKSRDSHWVDFLAQEFGELIEALTQTPQVWIDLQIVYQKGGVFLNWDVAEELFPAGMLQDMFSSFCALLRRLAEDESAWDQQGLDTLPSSQRELLARVNDTARPLSGALLHTGFFKNAAERPDALAVASSGVELSYGELSRRASRLGHALRERGAAPNHIVAVVMEKGWEQVVATLGILSSGAAYLPIDVGLPLERRFFMMENSGVKRVVTQPKFADQSWPEGVQVLVVTPEAFSEYSDQPLSPVQGPEDLAHILYTSGSTGLPNGVMLSHAGMVNGVEWTNRKFGVGSDDRLIALSALHHDFSVYDIFGTLSAGGALVIPDASKRRDPSHWAELMARYGISIWSTVPAMMEMLLTYLEGGNVKLSCPLRLVMLGGDWIAVTMPARLRARFSGAKVISVGGPTETSLWNISHPVAEEDERRRSIPYGKPISNTHYYVLDDQLNERPIWVPGELCCAGIGVAKGYIGAGAGSKKFTTHPRTGERIYRTGDLGRYLPDGTIEFLGRVDFQLSIRGQRIEPGEIETALLREPSISAAVVSAVGEHHEKRLVAYVVPSDAKRGVDTRRVREFLGGKLPEHMVPATYVVLDALPLTRNAKVDRKALPHPDKVASSKPSVAPTPAAAASAGQQARALAASLTKVVGEVLGVSEVPPDRNFFELGANSVHLVKLHLRLKEELGAAVSIVDLFGNPTVRALSEFLGDKGAEQKPEAARESREEAAPQQDSQDIAIIGMSGRFPGAPTLDDYWRNLVQGVESISSFTDEELLAAGVSPTAFRDPRYIRASAVMEGHDQFDADFFSMTPREARALDPQQRVFLECAWEALEHAGYPPKGGNAIVGVYAGKSVSHYRYPYPDLTRPINFFQELVSQDKDFLATQTAYKLDLRGPGLNLQTACSTSLVSVSVACDALLNGHCDMALAGGVALKVPHRVGYLYEEGSVFSGDGHCRPFDSRASGTIPGSGAGVVVLKRLSQALADGDRVLAVIKGAAINNDGNRKVGFMAPGLEGQADVLRRAYRRAGVDPQTVSYVEAHGTGTAIGDPLEIAALTQVFGPGAGARSCGIGSVKSNIGHLDSAAGIASLIKVVLAFQHRTLPPSLHFEQPNPRIDFQSGPFYVVGEATPWTVENGPRRAGISSFGIGGTNAHLVLEEAPVRVEPPVSEQRVERTRHVLTLSARNETALRQLAGRYRSHLEGHEESLGDVCFSANTGRVAFEHRLAVVGPDRQRMIELLGAVEREESPPGLIRGTTDPARSPKLAFLFSGQGSQYVGVARDLYQTHPSFRRRLDAFDELLREYWDRSLLSVLYPREGEASPIDQIEYAQPIIFVIEYALAELWMSWGIQPDVLLGHSTGEIAAACIAGVFSVEDGLKLAVYRGRLMAQKMPVGANIAVSASAAQLEELLPAGKWRSDIAAVNAPDNVVVSGYPEEIEEISQMLEGKGFKVKRLNIPRAAHSAMVETILPEFRSIISSITYRPPSLPMLSGMTGEPVSDEIASPDYWCTQLRKAVRFETGVKTLYREGARMFVEIGPKATLLGMAARSLPEGECAWLPSLRTDDGGWQQMLESLSALFVRGLQVDWTAFETGYTRRKVVLPTYAFQRQRYWEEGAGLQRPNGMSGARPSGEEHPLLGQRVNLAVLGSGDLLFRTTLGASAPGFLDQHRVFGTPMLPGTAYVEMALAAGARLLGTKDLGLTNLSLLGAMTFPGESEREVQCAVSRTEEGGATVRIFSRPVEGTDGEWTLHASGALSTPREGERPTAEREPESLLQGAPSSLPVEEYYQRAKEGGVDFGPAFRGITQLRQTGNQVLARIDKPAELGHVGAYVAHPALLDACLQVVGGAYPDTGVTELYVPALIEDLVVTGELDDGVWSHAVVRPLDAARKRLRADIRIFGRDGSPRARVRGLELQRTSLEVLSAAVTDSMDEWLYERRWEPMALTETDASAPGRDNGPCLILADRGGLGRQLADALARDGRSSVLAFRGPAFRRIDETSFEVPAEPAALAEALGALELPGPLSDAILLWGLDGPTADDLDGKKLGESNLLGAGAGLGLLQYLIKQGHSRGVWLVTRGAQPVESGLPLPGIAQSLLWGMARPLPIESSELDCRCVDLDPRVAVNTQVESLAREIRRRAEVTDDQVAFRGGRYVARLRRTDSRQLSSTPGAREELFHPDRSYLVVGGLGRLGLLTAGFLAHRGARHIILTGRSPAGAAASTRMERLRELGARVEYRQVDIAEDEQLAALLAEIEREFPPLAGVFHSAGWLNDGVVRQQSWDRFESVLRPKVQGAWNLHLRTAGLPLDHFVLFSSVASLVGSAGQANHCAATSFLDALAHHRRAQGLPGLSINWGVWAGDAGARVEVSEQARSPGFGLIPKQQGLRALELLLKGQAAQVGVAAIDWSASGSGRPTPYLADLKEKAGGRTVERGLFMTKLVEAPVARRQKLLMDYLNEQLAWMRGMSSGEQIDPTRGFHELGIDSLASLQLKNRLQSGLGLSLPATLVFNYPTIEKLAEQLMSAFIPLEFVAEAASQPAPSEQITNPLEGLSDNHLANMLAEQLSKMS